MKRWPKLVRRTVLAVLCLVLGGHVFLGICRSVFVPGDAPLIGVSFDTAWHARVGMTTVNYEIVLTRAGAEIVELRPGAAKPEAILGRIDALLLAGGGDVDPERHGGPPAGAELVDRRRDEFELALIRGALERDMPILGICRGIQILNVSQGGTLRNLRGDEKLAEVHGVTVESMDAHEVRIAAESTLAGLVGAGRRRVNSFHGQAVGVVGEGLRVAAVDPDGVVEAIESARHRFVIGMQWHPEIPPPQMAVFEAFLGEARSYRHGRRK